LFYLDYCDFGRRGRLRRGSSSRAAGYRKQGRQDYGSNVRLHEVWLSSSPSISDLAEMEEFEKAGEVK
jgi:hypothetical protein